MRQSGTQAGRDPRLRQGELLRHRPDDVVPELFTTKYRSAIAFGRAREVTDPDEIEGIMRALAAKYSPHEGEEAFQREMKSSGALCVLALDIEHLTGKQGKELLKERKQTT